MGGLKKRTRTPNTVCRIMPSSLMLWRSSTMLGRVHTIRERVATATNIKFIVMELLR